MMKTRKRLIAWALALMLMLLPCAFAEDMNLDLDLDMDKIRDELDETYEDLLQNASELLTQLAQLADGTSEQADAAKHIFQAALEATNELLKTCADDFAALGIDVVPLTEENFAEELERLQQDYLAAVQTVVAD